MPPLGAWGGLVRDGTRVCKFVTLLENLQVKLNECLCHCWRRVSEYEFSWGVGVWGGVSEDWVNAPIYIAGFDAYLVNYFQLFKNILRGCVGQVRSAGLLVSFVDRFCAIMITSMNELGVISLCSKFGD